MMVLIMNISSEKGHCLITEYIQSDTLKEYSTLLDNNKSQKAIKLLPLMLQVLEGKSTITLDDIVNLFELYRCQIPKQYRYSA
jgi:hypothetical protein